MTEAEAIRGLRTAARRRERADKARREATDDLKRIAREAQKAGVSMSQIAREAGVSRQGLYDLLAERPS
jgi:DNA-binding phage protein